MCPWIYEILKNKVGDVSCIITMQMIQIVDENREETLYQLQLQTEETGTFVAIK